MIGWWKHGKFIQKRSEVLTKRQPDLQADASLPLSHMVIKDASPAQVLRYLANGSRGR